MTVLKSEKRNRRILETLCLAFGAFSFLSGPVVYAVWKFGKGRPFDHTYQVMSAVAFPLFLSAIPMALLALLLGLLSNRAVRRTGGKPSRDARAKLGMLLAAVGIGSFFISINLMRARIGGDGPSPVGSLRTINTAALTYSSAYGHGFPRRLSNLGLPRSEKYNPSDASDQAANLIDEILASGRKGLYGYYYIAGPVDSQGRILSYMVYADPVDPNAGNRHYFTDQTRVIRWQLGRQANLMSQPLN